MSRYIVLMGLVILLVLLLSETAHAQGPIVPTPPPTPITVGDVTPGDVAALQTAASTASAQLSSAQAGLVAAQIQYNVSAQNAAQARAAADDAAQKLKLQQTVQAVEAATQARSLADRADQERGQAGQSLQAAQQRVEAAQQNIALLTSALARAQAGNVRRDQTIAQRDDSIVTLTNQVNDLHQQRNQTNTLIVLLACDVLIMAVTALFIFRQLHTLRHPVTIVEERTPGPAPRGDARPLDDRLPADAPAHVTDQDALDRINDIFEGAA